MDARERTSYPGSRANDPRVGAETSLRERFPNRASVLSSGEDLVSLFSRQKQKLVSETVDKDEGEEQGTYGNDRITSVLERRTTRLKFHSIDDELNRESVSMSWYLLRRFLEVFLRVVTGRIGRVDGGREEGRVEPMVVDQVLGEFEEHLGPDFSDRVNA